MDLYEAELPPAESVADGGERGYSQQEKQAKSQNPHGVVGVWTPGRGGVKHWSSVLPDLKVTVHKTERYVQTVSVLKQYSIMQRHLNLKLYMKAVLLMLIIWLII